MDRNEGPQTPWEVYCYNCHTSFAAGTQTCIHCGHRIGARPGQATNPGPDVFGPEEEEELTPMSLGRRLSGLGIWILLALGATLMRLCEG